MAKQQKNTVSELGPNELKIFQDMLKESVVCHFAIDQQKQQLSSIAERAKDELGIQTNEFKKYSGIAFESDKAKEQLDKAEEVYENSVRLGLTAEHDYNRHPDDQE